MTYPPQDAYREANRNFNRWARFLLLMMALVICALYAHAAQPMGAGGFTAFSAALFILQGATMLCLIDCLQPILKHAMQMGLQWCVFRVITGLALTVLGLVGAWSYETALIVNVAACGILDKLLMITSR